MTSNTLDQETRELDERAWRIFRRVFAPRHIFVSSLLFWAAIILGLPFWKSLFLWAVAYLLLIAPCFPLVIDAICLGAFFVSVLVGWGNLPSSFALSSLRLAGSCQVVTSQTD
ncbi:MAG: hypothetical protein Q7T45_22730 [Bradyrhizobium sp.]|uniref:hypothetical protein n=1 Tax=Bradyrhizobium sp. TaxID=376 RepID=UPI002724E495|nr:hypothetical protein [Bradyrhizobium sp.]MDO8400634.1 hypothetical protein [Bradyrhizobium sp.]